MSNILKGIVTIEAPGVEQVTSKVATAVGKTELALKKLSPVSNQATFALYNLSRVAQDAPYGFIGIANNLNPLLESFQRLKQSTGSTGGALKALGSSLTGAGGIGLALGVVSSLLISFGDKLFGAKAHMTAFQKVFEESKDVYVDAVKNVSLLTNEIELAKNGFISKEGVVKHYNETIGKTTGFVQNLNEAEQALNKNAQAYIDFTLKKAVANVALGKAAEIAFKLEQQQQAFTSLVGKEGFGIERIANPALLDKISNKMGSLRKEMEKLLDIGKQSETEAGNIAKLFGFNFSEVKTPSLKIKPDKVEIDRPKLGSIEIELPTVFDKQNNRSRLQQQLSDLSEKLNLKIPVGIDLSSPGKSFQNLKKDSDAILERLRSPFIKLGEDLSASFSQGFQSGFESFGEGLGNLLSGKNFGSGLTDAIGGLLKSLGQALIKFGIVKEGLDKIFGPGGILLPGSVAIGLGALAIAAGAAIKNFGGARALGGPVRSGQAYLVGERGPELFSPSVNGSIIPNNRMGSYSGGGLGGRVVFEISGNKLIGVLANGNRSQRSLV